MKECVVFVSYGHEDGLHFGAIISDAVRNIHIHMLKWTSIFLFLGYTIGRELLSHMVIASLTF